MTEEKKKIVAICDYCQEKILEGDEDEEHDILSGDECITLCDACYEHMQ